MDFLKKTEHCEQSEHYHQILHIWNSLGTIFQLKLPTLNIWTKLTQKVYFQPKTEKSKNHHWILHIRISLGPKFQFQKFQFPETFSQKGYYLSQTNKVNITIEFCIFELNYNLGHNILELYNILVQVLLTASKTKRDI